MDKPTAAESLGRPTVLAVDDKQEKDFEQRAENLSGSWIGLQQTAALS